MDPTQREILEMIAKSCRFTGLNPDGSPRLMVSLAEFHRLLLAHEVDPSSEIFQRVTTMIRQYSGKGPFFKDPNPFHSDH